MIRQIVALSALSDSAFLLICRVIPSNAYSILLPVPCKAFSSIIVKSSLKAYFSVRYSPYACVMELQVFLNLIGIIILLLPFSEVLTDLIILLK